MEQKLTLLFLSIYLLIACGSEEQEPGKPSGELAITYVFIGEKQLSLTETNTGVANDEPVEIRFDHPLNRETAEANIRLLEEGNSPVDLTFSFFSQDQLLKLDHPPLDENSSYLLEIPEEVRGEGEQSFAGQTYSFITLTKPLAVEAVLVDEQFVDPGARIKDVNRQPVFSIRFNVPVVAEMLAEYMSITLNGSAAAYTIQQEDEQTVALHVDEMLMDYRKYLLGISSGISDETGRPFDGFTLPFYTELDSTPKFPELSDEDLLTLVQRQTFRYFWDFAHPVSGLARERHTSGETVTIGGSGFGVMALLVGMERGFISREEGVERLSLIVDFLAAADRFHGVWPHWMNGSTGKVIPFSADDNGGDIVETAFMIQGLLSVRQYLNPAVNNEKAIRDKITALWEAVDWTWYTQDENVIFWHWSPNYGFAKKHRIRGWNEALIVYVLAASSPDHGISADVYHQGWAGNGNIVNGQSYYSMALPLGEAYGGPLFFEHYSFLGLDPRQLNDQYAAYWEQARAHTLINRAFCMNNPGDYVGYSTDCWGLTASDDPEGYSAHSPTNDSGVITPSAALSSFPFTPDESMQVLKHLYYRMGDRLWGEYGFYDAFDSTEEWYADSYLAIDQGPIIIMIENHRSALLWNLFMNDPDIQSGLDKLNFSY